MPETFLVSDTHFGHANICKFLNEDGSKVRPWADVNEMDEYMVDAWNKVVKPTDKVYHLGDVVINRKALSTLYRLNGDKVLIKGNHDIFKLADYTPHFRDIRSYHVLNNKDKKRIILSHIPIHEDSLERFKYNIHGHLHGNRVMKSGVVDYRYINVCVEWTNFAPIALDMVLDNLTKY